MTRVILRGLVVCLLVLPAGCGRMIEGNWRSIEPVEIPPDVPRIRQVTFEDAGRFHARLLQHHRVISTSGTYLLTGGKLVLAPDSDAGVQSYECNVRQVGNVLILSQNNRTYRLCRDSAAPSTTQPAMPILDAPTSEPAPQPPGTQTAVASQRSR